MQCPACGAQIPWHTDGTVPRHIDRGRLGYCQAWLKACALGYGVVATVPSDVRPASIERGDLIVVQLPGEKSFRVRVVDAEPTEHGQTLRVERLDGEAEERPGYGLTLSEPTVGADGRPQRGSPGAHMPGDLLLRTLPEHAEVPNGWTLHGHTVHGRRIVYRLATEHGHHTAEVRRVTPAEGQAITEAVERAEAEGAVVPWKADAPMEGMVQSVVQHDRAYNRGPWEH